jgi:opacity protein-like surface antigen
MKSLLALAVLATSATAFAQSRDIFDIMYLPTAGTSYGFSEIQHQSRTQETNTNEFDITGIGLAQTIGHSFSDLLSVQGTLNYANLEFNPSTGSSTQQSGLGDAQFTGRYRAFEDGYTLDFLGGLLIGWDDAQVKKNGDTNNKQGGHAVSAGAQYGKKTDLKQWAVLGQLTHNLTRNLDTSAGDEDLHANNELLLRADLLNKFSEISYLRSFASLQFDQKVKGDSSVGTFIAPMTSYVIGGEYQRIQSKNLMLRGGVDYTMINMNSGTVDFDRAWTLRLAANYQF